MRYTVELILKGTSQNVGDVLGGAADGLGHIGSAAATALGTLTGNLATAAISRVIDLGRAIGDTLFNEAPALEQVRTSFENLATSAGQSADTVLTSMRDASRGMITDADLMTSYNEALLLVGDNMAGEFPALLEIASASAAATGQDVGFMLDSLVKGIGRASPMILDNLGLTINMSEVMDNYAASVGKNTDELTKAEQQTALLNAVTAQGADFVERLGDNTGGAAQSVGRFRTTLENVKQQAVTALLPALVALLEPLGQLATQYGPQVVAWATEAGKWLGENIPIAVERLREIWERVFPQVQSAMLALQDVSGAVWPFIQGLIARVVDWIEDNMPLIIAAGQALADFWTNTLQPVVEIVWLTIQGTIAKAVSVILGIIQVVLGILAGDWDAVWEGMLQVVEGIWDAILDVIINVLEIVASLMGTSLSEIADTWAYNFEQLWEIISAVFGRIMEFLQGPVAAVMQDLGLGDLLDGLFGGNQDNSSQTTIYGGVSMFGVQDGAGLIEQLQALSTP